MAETKFSNPLEEADDRDPTVGAIPTTIFDDDAARPVKARRQDSTDRRQERANARSVQQFVEEQSTPCRPSRGGLAKAISDTNFRTSNPCDATAF
jgi:hypothetical protein